MRSHLARLPFVALLATAFSLGFGMPATSAKADASQLCRSITSVALAPTDVLLGPVIAAHDMHYGLTEIGDALPNQLLGIVPGFFYLNAMQVGGGLMRVLAGALEFPLGLATLFRSGSQQALFRAQIDSYALVSEDFGPCPIRIGTSYNSINEF